MFKKQKNALAIAGNLKPSTLGGLKLRFANRLANAAGMSVPEAMKYLV